MIEIEWVLHGDFVRRTPEVSGSPRGWGEGSVERARFRADPDPDYVLLVLGDEEYRVERELLAQAAVMKNEVP